LWAVEMGLRRGEPQRCAMMCGEGKG
jgi:hypothetical protein